MCGKGNIISKKVTYSEWESRVDKKTDSHFELLKLTYEQGHVNANRKEAFLYIKHVDCGHIFKRRGGQWLKTQSCPKCLNLMKVSYLHAIICIIFDEYYENVVFEKDIGFKGRKGGKSKYDLYVPNFNGQNSLFEFQSRFHDGKEKFDEEKKIFAENHGYKYYSFDHRNDNINEVIHSLFPSLYEVPEWAIEQIHRFQKPDLSGVQQLLNQCLPASKISEELGISEAIIQNAIKDKIVSRIDGHKEKVYNIKPIVQLDLNGNFIQEFSTMYQANKQTGINPITNLRKISKHAGGYIWLYKEEYEKGNYIIPDKNKLRFTHNSL